MKKTKPGSRGVFCAMGHGTWDLGRQYSIWLGSVSLPFATLTLIGCQNPSLSLSLAVPSPYREQLSVISLNVFSLDPDLEADCDAAAFAELGQHSTRLDFSKELTLGESATIELAGIDRQSPKLFIARGYDRNRRPLVAACGAVNDPIAGPYTASLTAEPITRAFWIDTEGTGLNGIDAPWPSRVVFEVRDVFNTPLADSATRWRIQTSEGTLGPRNAVTGAHGQAQLDLDPAIAPGPAVLEVRSRWARDNPLVLRSLVPPKLKDATIDSFFLMNLRIGRVGPAGQVGFAALGVSSEESFIGVWPCSESPLLITKYYDTTTGSFRSSVAAFAEPDLAFDLVVIPGTVRDRVIVLARDAWREVQPDGSTTTVTQWPSDGVCVRAHRLGPCSAGDQPVIIIDKTDAVSWQVFSVDGVELPDHPLTQVPLDGRVDSTGCITDEAGSSHPVVIVEGSSGSWSLRNSAGDVVDLTGVGSRTVFGFTSDSSNRLTTSPLWVGDLDLDGARAKGHTLSGNSIVSSLGRGFEEARDAALTQMPFALVGAALSNDDEADLIALFAVSQPNGSTNLFLQLSLATKAAAFGGSMDLGQLGFSDFELPGGGLPLGVSGLLPRLWTADFTGNGRDEILIYSGASFGSAGVESRLQLLVFDAR